MPDLDCTQGECVADFNLRQKTRLTYPGACSLEYQDIIRIVIEDLLQWDIKKQCAKGKGIIGTPLALAPADKEQGRKTLHSHWQCWTKELCQKLRDQLFDNDEKKKAAARKKFTELIDKLLHTSYGPDLEVVHTCNDVNLQSSSDPTPAGSIFKNRESQVFRDARNKTLCHDIQGRVMQCMKCGTEISTTNMINLALESWHDKAKQAGSPVTEQVSQNINSRFIFTNCKNNF